MGVSTYADRMPKGCDRTLTRWCCGPRFGNADLGTTGLAYLVIGKTGRPVDSGTVWYRNVGRQASLQEQQAIWARRIQESRIPQYTPAQTFFGLMRKPSLQTLKQM